MANRSDRGQEEELKDINTAAKTPPAADADGHRYRPPLSRLRIIGITLGLCLGGALVSIDSVITSVALPSISNSLGATTSQYSWVGSAYLLVAASMMPICAAFAELLGQKIILLGGLVLLLVGSLVSALASDANMLIGGRAVQGIGEGAFTVLANMCIAELFDESQRGLYIAFYAGASCIGAAIAPLLGGVITQYVGWRWIFWINLPITAVAIVPLVAFLLPSAGKGLPGKSSLRRVDWIGIVLVSAGTVLTLLGLQFGGVDFPWKSGTVISLIAVGSVTLLLFIAQQTMSANAFVPVRLVRDASGCGSLVVCVSHGFTYIGVLYYLPVYLQLVLEVDALDSGLWLLITAIATTVITIAAALIIQCTGNHRDIIRIAAACLTLGIGLFISFGPTWNYPKLVMYQLIVAVGIGPLFQAPLTAMQRSVTASEVGKGFAAFIFLRTISSAVSLVVGQVVLQKGLKSQSSILLEAGVPSSVVDNLSKTLNMFVSAGNLSLQSQGAFKEAMAFALSRVWIFYTAVAGAGLFASVFVRNRSPGETPVHLLTKSESSGS